MQRIKTLAGLLMGPALLFGLIYPATELWGTWRYALFEPELWRWNRWFEPGADIATGTRLVYGALWSLPPLFGGLAMAMALGCLQLMRQGILFDARLAARLKAAGACTALSSATNMVMMGLTPTIISWHNPSGVLPPALHYNSETVGLIFCGAGFWLVGWVLAEAIRIARENEQFI